MKNYCKLNLNLTGALDIMEDYEVAALLRAILHYERGLPVPELPVSAEPVWAIVKADLYLDRLRAELRRARRQRKTRA